MKAIIYGIGSFAEYVAYVISNDSNYEICGFCVDNDLIPTNKLSGLTVVAFETVEKIYYPSDYEMFIAVGDNEIREQKFHQANNLLSYISSKSITWDNIKYGKNVFIGEGSVIHPFVKISDNSIFIGAKVGHHSTIGKNNLLSGCYLGGNVKIGHNCFLGIGSSVKQGISIGNHNIIGLGCAITKNTSNNEIYTVNNGTKKSNVPSTRMKKKYLR